MRTVSLVLVAAMLALAAAASAAEVDYESPWLATEDAIKAAGTACSAYQAVYNHRTGQFERPACVGTALRSWAGFDRDRDPELRAEAKACRPAFDKAVEAIDLVCEAGRLYEEARMRATGQRARELGEQARQKMEQAQRALQAARAIFTPNRPSAQGGDGPLQQGVTRNESTQPPPGWTPPTYPAPVMIPSGTGNTTLKGDSNGIEIQWRMWSADTRNRLSVVNDQVQGTTASTRRCKIQYTVYPNGRLVVNGVAQSSGDPGFDAYCVRTLGNMSMQPFPPHSHRASVTRWVILGPTCPVHQDVPDEQY